MTERMWNCPSCKAEIPSEAKECPGCHRSLDWNAPPALAQSPPKTTRVIVTGLDLPFGDLIALLIKLSIASIPAAIILTIIVVGFGGLMFACMTAATRLR